MIPRPPSFLRRGLGGLLCAMVLGPALLAAQDGGPGTGGVVRLEQERRFLGEHRRVLVIGAHPDDEDTDLITILSRGMGVRTAYLSLTRGEGGQNLIGGELGAALGVVRTEELLAARAVDGGQQFFTRAYDFGFSKSAEETFRFWPRDSVLKDMVRVIRRFRPHVIVSVWSGTDRDGHGHHQASGMLAREAFGAAADPMRFPDLARVEALPAWTATKLYVSARFDPTAPALVLHGGVLDPATGHSLHQLAMRSRSRHRSQDMGRLEEPGPASTRVVLVERAAGVSGPDTSFFAGVAAEARRPDRTAATIQLIERGIVVDAYVEDAEVVRGQRVPVTALAWNAGADTVVVSIDMVPRDGWERGGESECAPRTTVPPGEIVRCTVPMQVLANAFPDQPYFLREALQGGMYTLSGRAENFGEPFERPLEAIFTVGFSGESARAVAVREVMARSLDQAIGEVREPVVIMPRVLLDVAPGRALWPRGERTRPFTVTVEHAAADSTHATVRLLAPEGWTTSDPLPVAFGQAGERRTLTFDVTAPADVADGEASFLVEAAVGVDTMRIGVRRVTYPHIRERVLFQMAEASVVVAPVRFPTGRRIGYIRGAADAIPEALAAARVPFRLLDLDALQAANLDSLDVIVVGPRAYEINEALTRVHADLLAWAERGGTLITQYQQYQYLAGGFPPLPMTIGRPHDRVTDETAPVTLLDPTHRALRGPNALVPTDFDGWVQERGLYFARSWDSAWTPLLELHDPGEAPLRGALLVAPFGRGTVVYTGIAFFRQLPAAVPGAWKLFANLLAL